MGHQRRGRALPSIWAMLACIAAFAAGHHRGEAADGAKAAAAEPQGGTASEVLAARGILAFKQDRLVEALELLREAIAAGATAVPIRHYLGVALLRQGRTTEGRRVLAAAARESADPRLLTDLAMAYTAEGNHAWAVRMLRRAAEAAPRDGSIRYHLGSVLLRLGNAAEALQELQRAERMPGAAPQALALQIGLAHYLERRWAKSREHLAGILTGQHGAAARRLLRAAYEGEGTPASLLSAELRAGAAIDTNPLYEHERTSPSAVALALEGRFVLRPWVDARNLLSGEIRGARAFLFPAGSQAASATGSEPTVGDVSRTELRASAAFARRRLFGGSSWGASAAYDFGLVFFDGAPGALARAGEPTLVDEHHIFVEAHGIHVALEQLQQGLQLRYSLTRQAFADLPRGNWGNELSLEHTRLLWNGRLRILGWAHLRHEAADSADYDALAPGAGVGLSALLPGALVLGLRCGYEHKNHYRSADARRWGLTQRVDNTVDFTVEASRALWLGMRLVAVYQRLQKLSTVDSFDYGKDFASLALSWSYR